MKKIFLIIGREFSVRVRKKSFIITTILVPLLVAIFMVIVCIIPTLKDTSKKIVAVIDHSGIAQRSLLSTDELIFVFYDNATLDSLRQHFNENDWYAIVDVSAIDDAKNVSINMYALKQPNLDVQQHIENTIEKTVEQYKLQSFGIHGLDSIMAAVKTNIHSKTYIWNDDGTEKASFTIVNMVVSYFFSFMIYMFITLFGSIVMRGVIEEKTNRIVEVIVSSVKPFQLMIGKIIGVASVGLLQFIVWILLIGIIYIALASSINITPNNITTTFPVGDIDGQNITHVADMSYIIEMLKSINFVTIIMTFICYFLCGYFLYASLYAAIGSAVENEADTQQLVIPISIPLIIGLLLMLHTFKYPNSSLSFWGSMIPFTSPMVMMARIPFGVPFWQLALSLFLAFITFIGIAWFAGKIYHVGILTYGKTTNLKALWKWVSYKN